MDISSERWYGCGHETQWLCPTTTGAAHQGGVALAARSLLPRGGPDRSILDKLAGALDAILPAQRQRRVEASAHAGAAAPNETPAAARVDRAAKTGSAGGGLPHPDVDHPPRRRANPTPLGRGLSSGA